ncbi:MAG: hypothetical protein DRJ42_20750 [Deltaproteobacteria bacterium]|nr:MAG: hypothetical protein DRJ42_20750 [Deltaproteobacteria bacterium]
MGGTAIAYVNDGSAFFHNPAGIGAYDTANVLLNVSLLLGGIHAAPTAAGSIDSELTVAPLPMLGGGVRLFNTNAGGENNFALVLGAGVFPVASAGGKYEYPTSSGEITSDSTTLVFFEAAPGIGLAIENTALGDFRLGATYRITYVSLSRAISYETSPTFVDFSSSGVNAEGFRVGFQWQPIDEVQFGFSYRHRIDTDIESEGGRAINLEVDSVSTTMTLPGKLGWGLRGDYANIGLALDIEYSINSQNTGAMIVGKMGDTEIPVPNVFNWSDALTLRVGGEYDIELGEESTLTPRLGFIFDDKTGQKEWPTAFGTPPTATYSLTLGVGYDGGPWEVNAAYAYRTGSTTVTEEDIIAGEDIAACSFCGHPGEYSINLHGISVDFSYDFD